MGFGGKDPITRRDLLRGAVTGMIALAAGVVTKEAQRSAKPPNVVFILADDLGYADVSCYGRPDLKTPHIDRIAAQGVRFLQGYANSAVCSATRTALITGRYQYRLRLGLEEPLAGNPDVGLPPEHPTLPSLLKKVGYTSTLVGKWHLGVLPKFGPLKSGYDHFYGFRGGAVDYFSHAFGRDMGDLWDDDVPIHQVGYLTRLLGDRAVDVVNRYAKSGQPFLVSLHFNAPHWPWEAPGDDAESERLRQPGTGGLADRDGDYKFLKILDNTFLFNVVEDPLERANLKERQKDVYQRLAREWYEWNRSMLPEIKESYTASFDGQQLADHFGAKKSDLMPDIPVSPDD